MKVKITKCSDKSFWYKDFVGCVFEVIDKYNHFVTIDNPFKDKKIYDIPMQDCEIVEYDNPAKQTEGKPNWNLVNLKHLEGLVRVREYGVNKYPDGGADNWQTVPPEALFTALVRHVVAMSDKGIYSLDEESGLPHMDHAICNLYFLKGLMK